MELGQVNESKKEFVWIIHIKPRPHKKWEHIILLTNKWVNDEGMEQYEWMNTQSDNKYEWMKKWLQALGNWQEITSLGVEMWNQWLSMKQGPQWRKQRERKQDRDTSPPPWPSPVKGMGPISLELLIPFKEHSVNITLVFNRHAQRAP